MKKYFHLSCLLLTSILSCHHKAPESIQVQEFHPAHNSAFRYDDLSFLDSLRKNKIVALWRNQDGAIETAFLKDGVRTIVDRIDTLKLNGKVIYAVQTESRPPDVNFHSAGALCLIYFFKQDDAEKLHFIKSNILYSDNPLMMLGSWGKFPKTTFMHIGDEKFAYKVEPGFTGQGQTTSSILIFEITDSLDIPEVLSFDAANYDNSGICGDTLSNFPKCCSYNTQLKIIGSETTYYNISAEKKGSNLVDNKIINIDSTFYYTYKERKYELTKTVVDEKDTDSK